MYKANAEGKFVGQNKRRYQGVIIIWEVRIRKIEFDFE